MRNLRNEATKYLKTKDFRFWLALDEPAAVLETLRFAQGDRRTPLAVDLPNEATKYLKNKGFTIWLCRHAAAVGPHRLCYCPTLRDHQERKNKPPARIAWLI